MKFSKLKNIKKLSWNIERLPSYGHFVIRRFLIPAFQASSSYSFQPIHFKLGQNVDFNERIKSYQYHFFMRPLFHAQKGRNIQKPLVADIHFCSFWSDFSFISKNLTKSKNEGLFLIVTFEIAIIKWPSFFDLVKFLLMKLKSLQKLQKCMSATSGFWMFRPF